MADARVVFHATQDFMTPVFQIPDNYRTYSLFAGVALVLTLVTFGSLSEHLFSPDDFEHLNDADVVLQDFSQIFSPNRSLPGRPVVEVVFLVTQSVWGNHPAAYYGLLIGLHLLGCLLLAYTFYFLGIDLELSLLASLFFLVNAAHYRAVQWISCLAYPLTLILSLLALICFVRFLQSHRLRWIVFSSGLMLLATFAHASAISVALFCGYLSWRQLKSARRAIQAVWPLLTVSLLGVWLLYVMYPRVPQVAEVSAAQSPAPILTQFLGYLGRLIVCAFWLPEYAVDLSNVEIILGLGACVGIISLVVRQNDAVADWAVWTVLTVLPFLYKPQGFGSRYLYLSSAGSSLVLAWLVRSLMQRAATFLEVGMMRVVFSCMVTGLIALGSISLKRSEAFVYYDSGKAYNVLEDYPTALAQFVKAIEHDVAMVPFDVYSRLAMVAFYLGKPLDDLLEGAPSYDLESAELRMLLGVSAFLKADVSSQREGDWQIRKAFEQSEDKQELRNKAATAFSNVAKFYLRQKQYQKAVELFEKSRYYVPENDSILAYLGYAYYYLGAVGRAIEIYQKLLEHRPDHVQALENLGNIWLLQGQVDGAIGLYERVIAIDGSNIQTYKNLGLALKQQGRMDELIGVYRKAITLQSEDADLHFDLGNALYTQGKIEGAIPAYREAIRIRPGYAEAYENLGVSLAQTGRTREALQAFQQALVLNPDSRTAGRYLQVLDPESP
ncbi:MAG: tetratricopeptide repeat protein [bacterium]|nr:tetratricopeptide repeat protein [bacterium]